MKRLLFGILAGISAGLLFAPKSGKKLREALKKSDTKFSDFADELLKAAKDAGTEVKTLIDSKEVQDMITSGKKSAEDFLNIVDEKKEELSKKAKVELDELLGTALESAKKTGAKAKKTVDKKTSTAKKAVKKKASDAKKTIKKAVKK